MAGDGAARNFYRHDGRCALKKRNHEDAQHVEESVLVFGDQLFSSARSTRNFRLEISGSRPFAGKSIDGSAT
jgi:hypothetical protein